MLTQEQLQQIEKYVALKVVRYYDVRIEIADHLGELVAGAMQKGNISFETALQEQGAAFSEDWDTIVKYKTRYLRLKFLHIFRKEFLGYFSWPKIGITILLMALVCWIETYPSLRISKSPYLVTLLCISIYFRRKDKHSTAFLQGLKSMNKLRGGERQVMIEAIRKKSTWLNLLSARQLTRVSTYFACIEVLYVVAAFVATIYHLDLLSRLVVYVFPIVFIVTLAWQKVRIEISNTIHKDYAHVPGR
jgi:hypothetical protein